MSEPIDLSTDQDAKQILLDALITAAIVYETLLKDAQKKGDIPLEVLVEKQRDEARNWIRILQEKHVLIVVGV